MIRSKETVLMSCDYQEPKPLVETPDWRPAGCAAFIEGRLVLKSDGTWFAEPVDKVEGRKWVTAVLPLPIGNVTVCRCPAHPFAETEVKKVSLDGPRIEPVRFQAGPAGLKPINGTGRPRH